MLDWFAVTRPLVSKLEFWIMEGGILFLLLMILLRSGWMFYRFHAWPLSDLQMLFPALLIGVLLLVNWSMSGLSGILLGGSLGLLSWYLGCCMFPFISWSMADLPQWIVHASLGFALASAAYVSLARSRSRLRLRLHGRDWILRHLPGETFYRRLDAQRHLNGLGLISR